MTNRTFLRIQIVFLFFSQLLIGTYAFHVALKMQKFVERHHSVILKCDYNMQLDMVYKVEWHKHGRKIFQFIKDRNPPFRNFTVQGATLDLKHSDEKQIRLKNLDIEASDYYSCSVSTETPIYTKQSENVHLTVFVRQSGNPEISLRKESYTVGEALILNCTSAPAIPTPAVTWLLNGHKVDFERLQSFHQGRHSHGHMNLNTSTTQLTLDIADTHVAESGLIELTCVSTIPAFLDDDDDTFVDKRTQNISVEVHKVQPIVELQSDSGSGNTNVRLSPVLSLVLIFSFFVHR